MFLFCRYEKGLLNFVSERIKPSSETQGRLVGPGEKLHNFRRAFSPGPTDRPWVSEDGIKLYSINNTRLAFQTFKTTIYRRGTQRPNVSKYARSVSNGFLLALEACLVNLELP